MTSPTRGATLTVLGRGIRCRCPQCGDGLLFDGWYRLRTGCDRCGYRYPEEKGDNFAFMYLSMAAINGMLFLAVFFLVPAGWWTKRFILIGAMVVANAGLIPLRKSLALAIDLLVDRMNDGGAPPSPGAEEKPRHPAE